MQDTVFTQGKNKRPPLGDPSAKTRVFVPEAGTHRVHTFRKGEHHGVTEPELQRQPRSAGFAGTSKFDASMLIPDASMLIPDRRL
jgi:hypothetical protein